MAVDHNNPQSRDEEILIATIDGKEYDKAPQSRMEELLLELKETIEEGGGGGGTTNYNNLSNKPQVNGHTLSGNTTGADLDLVDAEDGKGLSTNDYDNTEKAAVAAATSAISAMKDGTDLDSFGDVEVALLDKADTADLGTAAAKDSTNAVTAGSTDLVESGAVKTAIDAAVAGAYHHAGTKTCAELVAGLLVKANEGNVYNMTDSGTTTSDFMEGIGYPIKAGDNVGVAKVSDGVYKFDLLSGFVDTTNFVQKSQTAGLLKNDGTVNDEIEDDVDQLKSGLTDLSDHVDGDATTYPYADVITIEDAVPANLADCSVKVEPVQDLHGYDKPWVGGAGKNKLPLVLADIKTANTDGTWNGNAYTVNGVTFTVQTDDDGNVTDIIVNGTATSNTYFDLVSVFNSSEYAGMIYNGSPSNNATVRVSGGDRVTKQDLYNGDTIRNSGDGLKIAIRVASAITINNEIFKPMISLSTETDATFAPYTNICPISGHTETVVTVADDDTDPTVTNTYTLALGDTIYGGTVDFDSGVMTVTHGYAEFDGSDDENWKDSQTYSDNSHNYAINNWSASNNAKAESGITNQYPRTTSLADHPNSFRIVIGLNVRAYFNSLQDWKTYLTTNNLQVVYELATPTTIQLTPQQIQLLKGQNTLTASTGDISVTVNGVSGAIGSVQEQVNDHEERIEAVESGKVDKLTRISNNVAVTDTSATQSISSIKGCNILLFVTKINSSVRNTLLIPYALFKTGVDVYIPIAKQTTIGSLYVKYNSDTSITLFSTISDYNYLDIYGDK